MEKIDKVENIGIVSPAFSKTNEIIRDINASREIYSDWDVKYFGRNQDMKSLFDAKIVHAHEYLISIKSDFRWIIVVDSNDSLFIRNFDSCEIIQILESFNKPVIFTSEVTCYPLGELEGLYMSKSINRYLNSGCIAIKSEYIDTLFDHAKLLHKSFPQYSKIGWGSPNDQTYFQLCFFSKEIGNDIALDIDGKLSVSTFNIPDKYFTIENNSLLYGNRSRPFILHCQGQDKHSRKRNFMKKLNIPVRG